MGLDLDAEARAYLAEMAPREFRVTPGRCQSTRGGKQCALVAGHYPRFAHSHWPMIWHEPEDE